jgi:predicted transglutaminase-like cysteine proteinase
MIGGRTAWQSAAAVAMLAIATFAGFTAKTATAGSPQLLLASFEGSQDLIQLDVERLPKWQRVRDWLVAPQAAAADPALRPWSDWAKSLRALPAPARLEAINRRVNASFRYATDLEVWGVRDHWVTPAEVVAKGATDCKGFATMKLWLAREAGIDPGDLGLLVGILLRSGQMHAVLLADAGQGPVVLDMLHAEIMPASLYDYFRPILAADLKSLTMLVGKRTVAVAGN